MRKLKQGEKVTKGTPEVNEATSSPKGEHKPEQRSWKRILCGAFEEQNGGHSSIAQ